MTARQPARVALRLGLVGGLVLLLLQAGTPAQDRSSRTVWDGIYSARQAARGDATFDLRCGTCHEASSFAGEEFMEEWDAQTVGDLYDFVRYAMPADSHEGYGSQEYADVIAYMLRLNGLPPGDRDLLPEPEALQRIRIQATRPE